MLEQLSLCHLVTTTMTMIELVQTESEAVRADGAPPEGLVNRTDQRSMHRINQSAAERRKALFEQKDNSEHLTEQTAD